MTQRASLVVSVDAIEEFHELQNKGGVLAGKNVRVFTTWTSAVGQSSSSARRSTRTTDQHTNRSRYG